MIISGMNIASYWVANFIYDYAMYLVIAIAAMLLAMAVDVGPMVEGDGLTATWITFILFGLACVPFTYVLSFGFS